MNTVKNFGAPDISMLLGAYETSFDKRTFNIDGFDSEIKPVVVKEFHPPMLSHQLAVLENHIANDPKPESQNSKPETVTSVSNSHVIVVAVVTTLATLLLCKIIFE